MTFDTHPSRSSVTPRQRTLTPDHAPGMKRASEPSVPGGDMPRDASLDWYQLELSRLAGEPVRLGNTKAIATEWGSSLARCKQDQLAAALTVARSFARLLGVPRRTDIRLARTAVAGFYDSPDSFNQPFILIDESAVLQVADPSTQLDIAIGMALHEAAHILWSRKIFLRISDDSRDHRLRPLENLLEDWRIEERLITEAPGWARYIYRTRKVLLVDQWLEQASQQWDEMVDTDRIGFFIGCFVRAPQLFERNPAWKRWTDLLGRNIFQELRLRLIQPPNDEDDVEELAKRLLDLVDDYWNRAFDSLTRRGKPSPSELERLRKQHVADEHDRRQRSRRRPRFRPCSLDEFLRALEHDSRVNGGSSEALIMAIGRAGQHNHGPDGTSTDSRALPRSLPTQCLPARELENLVLENETGDSEGRENYELARWRVTHLVERLRHAFRRQDRVAGNRHGVSSGKLDARRLWRAPFDDTLFSRERPRHGEASTLVALLLDASGSMSEGRRYERALETAVLINESLAQSSCRAEIFSHSTEEDRRCVLYYHGTACNASAASIGSYRPRDCNFDYQAIAAVTATLREPARQATSAYLISVSDGLPCTPDNQAGTGVEATRDAVVAARRQGWKVVSIGFGDAYCEQIYGKDWSIRIDDEDQLPHNFANLLIRLLR